MILICPICNVKLSSIYNCKNCQCTFFYTVIKENIANIFSIRSYKQQRFFPPNIISILKIRRFINLRLFL